MNRLRKWLLRVVAGVVVILVVGLILTYAISEARLNRVFEVHVPTSIVGSDDAETVERGRRLSETLGCARCHGADLGGTTLHDGLAVGRISSTNLTTGRGSAVGGYSDLDLVRAIRLGVRPNGRAIMLIPARQYRDLADHEIQAIVAFVRSVPPIDRELPATSLGPIGRLRYLIGDLELFAAEH